MVYNGFNRATLGSDPASGSGVRGIAESLRARPPCPGLTQFRSQQVSPRLLLINPSSNLWGIRKMFDLLLYARDCAGPKQCEGWYYVVVTVGSNRVDKAAREAEAYLRKVSTDAGKLKPSRLPVEYIPAYVGPCGAFDDLVGEMLLLSPREDAPRFEI